MAAPKTNSKQKTRRSRKARTEVSSSSDSSSSDSESSESTPEPQQTTASKSAHGQPRQISPSATSSDSDTTPPVLDAKTTAKAPEQVFEDFYLKQATKEFSEDLDKLRNAGDWRGQGSLEVLIGALKQGGACFGDGERARVGGGGS